jgi:hypothetical protein
MIAAPAAWPAHSGDPAVAAIGKPVIARAVTGAPAERPPRATVTKHTAASTQLLARPQYR